MPSSMTGFGRSEVSSNFGKLVIEIQSVNRKHLEVFLQLPKEFFRLEHEIRAWVGEKIHRGQITIRVQRTLTSGDLTSFLPELSVVQGLKKAWTSIAESIKSDPDTIDLRFIMDFMPSIPKTEGVNDFDLNELKVAVYAALDDLILMRAKEGRALSKDAKGRLENIEKMVLEIEKGSPDFADRMRVKLSEKMQMLFPTDVSLDDRVFKEIALYAEKADITEEITRLRSHFSQFFLCLDGQGPVGRKMDFVLQEIFREVNTIGSKSIDTRISVLVVEIKAELEKIREQIQNIE